MSKRRILDQHWRENRLEILKALAISIATEIDEMAEADGDMFQTDIIDGSWINLEEQVRKFEVDLIRFALFKSGGHQTKAARMLTMKPSTLNEKIKRYRISVLGYRPRGESAERASNG